MIQISNCPDTNLERFITAKDTLFYESAQQLIMACHISHYKSGEKIENTRIKSYVRNLVATIDSPVDPNTGQLRDDFEDPTTISEYQFFLNLKKVAIKQEEMELQVIIKSDLLGKFNI